MQERKYDELERRAIPAGLTDALRKAEAQSLIHHEIERMREEGKALTTLNQDLIDVAIHEIILAPTQIGERRFYLSVGEG